MTPKVLPAIFNYFTHSFESNINSKDTFSCVELNFDLTASQSHLDIIKNELFEAGQKAPTLIILKGPHNQPPNFPLDQKQALHDLAKKINTSLIGFYSSGSSGEPKLIIHSQQSLIQSALVSGELLKLHEKTSLISSLPLYHMGGFLCLLRSLIFQCPFHWVSSQEISAIALKKPNEKRVVVGVPAQIEPLLKSDKNLENTLTFYAGGDKVTVHQWADGQSKGINLISTYGQTESCGAILYQTSPDTIFSFSDVSFEFKAVDVNERTFQLGYQTARKVLAILDRKTLTLNHDKNEPFYTQDIVILNEDLTLPVKFCGRLDSQFQCGGEMISPIALERRLWEILEKENSNLFSKIKNLKVIPISHDRLAYIPVAFLEGLSSDELAEIKGSPSLKCDHSPQRLRALGLWPKYKGIKPSLKDFQESFYGYHLSL